MKNMERELARIAKETLEIETLESRNSDSLDFYERGVLSIKAALEAAYKAGMAAKTETEGGRK